jgi:hypothetical protein
MPKIKEAAVHVEILPNEVLESKRNILEIQLHLLNIIKALLSLKELIKTEVGFKKEIRNRMKEIGYMINQTLNILPLEELLAKGEEREVKEAVKVEKEEAILPKGKRAKIDAELQEIKKKLRKLM